MERIGNQIDATLIFCAVALRKRAFLTRNRNKKAPMQSSNGDFADFLAVSCGSLNA
jgi:hypothetical protein